MWKLDHGIDGKYPTHGKLERFFMLPSDTKFRSSSSTKDFWLACSDFHLFQCGPSLVDFIQLEKYVLRAKGISK